MHSPPIDLLNNAPKPQKAAPAESEPDGRFSELLRAPSEADTTRPDSGTAPKSNHAASAEGPSQVDATTEPLVEPGQQAAVEPVADAAAPESPQADKIGIAPLVVMPEATTWVEPQGGPMPGNAAVAPSGSSPGTPLPQTPTPAAGAITPPAPAAPSIGIVSPAPAQPPTQAGGAIGATVTPQTQAVASSANALNGGGSKAGAIEPGNAGAIPMAPAGSSPAASTQPLMATAAPVAAAGKSVAGSADAPRPSATAPTTLEATSHTVPSDRPASAPTPTPERLALAQTPDTGVPPAPNGEPDLPAATVSKATPDLGQAAANTSASATSAPKAVSTTMAASLANDKATATPATAVPSTVAETADAAPQAGQADPVAAANSGPAGRMTVTAASSTILAHTPSTAQPASEQVVLQVQRAVREGVDRLTMQLKPASLGRVDIQMEVGFDGRLQAVISAERPETLHLLQRDARMLTEALNDAGLQTDSGSLSFNLRGQAGDHGGGNGNEPTTAPDAARSNLADESAAATTEITLTLGDGRVDIKV